MSRLIGTIATGMLLVGCASTPEEDPWADNDFWNGNADAGTSPMCSASEHMCDGECVDEQDNDPSIGCALGCGDPCPAVNDGLATCGANGRCSAECDPGFMEVGGRCECQPLSCEDAGAMCGSVDDGCGGTMDCGGCEEGIECVANTCGCATDPAEPNESQAQATQLPDFSDRPRTTVMFEEYGLHSGADVDWYKAEVDDAFGDGNPNVEVTLGALPEGAVYQLGAWYVCNSGGTGSSCAIGNHDDTIGVGCSASVDSESGSVRIDANCNGTNDSGVLLVRVSAPTWVSACTGYQLEIDVN